MQQVMQHHLQQPLDWVKVTLEGQMLMPAWVAGWTMMATRMEVGCHVQHRLWLQVSVEPWRSKPWQQLQWHGELHCALAGRGRRHICGPIAAHHSCGSWRWPVGASGLPASSKVFSIVLETL